MPLDRQLFGRNIAETLADFLRQRKLTAKQAARRYGIDPSTAENIRKGVVSLNTLLKIALVEGRDLWNWLGDEIYGETLDAYEERRLQQIINEAADARQKLVRLRARREALASDAADGLDALDRPQAYGDGVRHG
jgi:transcriptional regulator with XRE-family HTH domain